MKTVVHIICSLLITGFLHAQSLSKKLSDAVKVFKADSQMRSAIIGFYFYDQESGSVYDENATLGLAVASSQKVITSAASLELLGTKYRYKTELAYSGTINNGTLNGNIYIIGHGDPTLGSWRFDNKEQPVLDKWIQALKNRNIKKVNGSVIGFDKNWISQSIPGGWIWDDIGNYYGAGALALNWRENQYDLKLKAGNNEGDKVSIVSTEPELIGVNLTSELITGKQGSGDNAYIYLPPYSTNGFVRGTIPPGRNIFTISGSIPNPAVQLSAVFINELQKQGIEVSAPSDITSSTLTLPGVVNVSTLSSPPLDSINYWFLKKSINLYGEVFVKTLGHEKKSEGSTEAGLDVIKSFWEKKGIDPTSINIIDGSGLSPGNRVTPEALVNVMRYARSRPWFSSFYNALPVINGIKMKSGSIGGVKSFTGYVKNYTFAIVINNYNGSENDIVGKMYRLLNLLK